jgi:hypothetical protein
LADIEDVYVPEGLIPSFQRFLGWPTHDQKMFLAKAEIDWISAFQKYLIEIESAALIYVSRMIKETGRTLHADYTYLNDYEEGTPMHSFMLRQHEKELGALEELWDDMIQLPRKARRGRMPD